MSSVPTPITTFPHSCGLNLAIRPDSSVRAMAVMPEEEEAAVALNVKAAAYPALLARLAVRAGTESQVDRERLVLLDSLDVLQRK